MRIVAVSEQWLGANSYAFVRAFRRQGHSVTVVPEAEYVPTSWKSFWLRAAKKVFLPILVKEFNQTLVRIAEEVSPHLLFIAKGYFVTPEAIQAIRKNGALAINFFPDVSVFDHGKYIPKALPCYDWIFTTKTFGIHDMRQQLNIHCATFLPHGYDPEVHRPLVLESGDKERYECDVSFVGAWSPKKQKMLEAVVKACPGVNLKIWGIRWEQALNTLGNCIKGHTVLGLEYAKALLGSKINVAILLEQRPGASSGDLITSRTFHIPATGAFMLHERTDEFVTYFKEGVECACFGDSKELIEKIRYYLDHPTERERLAKGGLQRSIDSRYSIDSRAEVIMQKATELLKGKA